MDPSQYSTIAEVLRVLPDPRHRRGCRYPWWLLLALIAVGLLSDQRSARALAQWAGHHRRSLGRYLRLPSHRMPSASTLARTLQQLDVGCFEREMAAFVRRIDAARVAAAPAAATARHLAVDGKEVRTASAYGPDVTLLSCVRHGSGITLAQQALGPHEGEVTVARRLLAQLDLRGQTVTLDAGFTGHRLLRQILDQGGDYLVVVKANCSQLYADIDHLFAHDRWLADCDRYTMSESGHGRQETRTITCSTQLRHYLEWPGVQQVLKRVRISRCHKTRLTSEHVTYAMTSLGPEEARAEALAGLWRAHWSIECKSHYVRDVSLGEDRCRIHTGTAPEALAVFRNGLLALLADQHWPTIPDALRYYGASVQRALQTLGF